jgi:hypothetical protein
VLTGLVVPAPDGPALEATVRLAGDRLDLHWTLQAGADRLGVFAALPGEGRIRIGRVGDALVLSRTLAQVVGSAETVLPLAFLLEPETRLDEALSLALPVVISDPAAHAAAVAATRNPNIRPTRPVSLQGVQLRLGVFKVEPGWRYLTDGAADGRPLFRISPPGAVAMAVRLLVRQWRLDRPITGLEDPS